MSTRDELIGYCLVNLPNEPAFEHAEVLADRYRAEVLADRDRQFVAWLLKKSREEEHGEVIARLASKVARGAVRPNNLRTDFFQPGHTYTHVDDGTDWKFRVDTVTTHPEDGERTALGWRHFRGQWEPCAYGEDDYEIHLYVGTADVTEGGAA
ncbi:hypothetical protein [Streptomyces sp. NPDC029526]|uniref:hypothetical protein n=1 Tax=Streptomyces sp. NPDC029526 TaxID=3155728 RepID=UPI0033C0177E